MSSDIAFHLINNKCDRILSKITKTLTRTAACRQTSHSPINLTNAIALFHKP
ncbi:hypothetical protein [Nostoc sp.]|uniref:hypothetical protein n=1 Tax=Nostoc sp. TaxID=1180 RepID=UPI002FFB827D